LSNLVSGELHHKTFDNLGGSLNELAPPGEIPLDEKVFCENWKAHKDGKSMVKRPGYEDFDTGQAGYDFGTEIIKGIFDFKDTDGDRRTMVITENKIYVKDPSVPEWNEVYSQVDAITRPIKPVAFESGRPIVVGFDKNLTIEPDASYELGLDPPETTPTVAVGAAGDLTGTYKYLVTFYRSGNYPVESNPSDASAEVSPATQKVDLTNIPTSADPKVNCRRIYRTFAGGAVFYWLVDIEDNVTTTYEDNIHDDSLGDEVSYDRYKPPLGDAIEVWDNRIWILNCEENSVSFTNTGEAEEMAAENVFYVKAREPDNLTTLKAFGDKLYLFKAKGSIHVIEKLGISSYTMTEREETIGCDAPLSVAGDTVLIFKSKHGIEVFNGSSFYRPVLSQKVQRTFDSINNAQLEKIYGEINRAEGEYWLAIPTEDNTEPNKVIVFDYIDPSFTVYDFYNNMGVFYSTRDGNEDLTFLGGDDNGGFYILETGYTDNGEPIEAKFQTGWLPISGKRNLWNVLRRVFPTYITPPYKDIKMSVYSNFKSDPDLEIWLEGGVFVDDEEIRNQVFKRTNCAIRGTHISFAFENNDTVEGECRVIGWDGYFNVKFWKGDVKGE